MDNDIVKIRNATFAVIKERVLKKSFPGNFHRIHVCYTSLRDKSLSLRLSYEGREVNFDFLIKDLNVVQILNVQVINLIEINPNWDDIRENERLIRVINNIKKNIPEINLLLSFPSSQLLFVSNYKE